MKKLFLITTLVISNLSFGQNVTVTDYEVPISTAQTLRLNAFWNWAQVGNSVTDNKANVDVIFRKFYSSLPFAWFIDVDLAGGWDVNFPRERDSSKYNHNVLISSSARKYIWEDKNLFTFAKINVQHADTFKQIASNLTLGAGYGRYIDATALAKAVRIEEHLIREGAITGHLPKNTIIKIANIIERQDEYINIYSETYETVWFYDIEKEISASGMMVGNNLGSIGILRIRQVLFGINERVNNRYYGWDVTFGPRFDLSTSDKSKVGSPKLNLSGRYSYPIGWRSQINSTVEVYTPMDSLFFRQINTDAGLDFIYELSNRINFVASYRLGVLKPYNEESVANNSLNIAFLFYIENNIYIGLNGTWKRRGNEPSNLSMSFSFQYNLF